MPPIWFFVAVCEVHRAHRRVSLQLSFRYRERVNSLRLTGVRSLRTAGAASGDERGVNPSTARWPQAIMLR